MSVVRSIVPDLSTTLHVDMLKESKRKYSLPRRLVKSIGKILRSRVYGTEWGDLEDVPPLKYTLEHWVLPYVKREHVALEIGPGGGRWTRHLLGFAKIYEVDFYSELLKELKKNFGNKKNIVFIKNNGSDFPGIPENSIHFCFSFGTFVHLDLPIIESYLDNIKSIIKPGANVVIHYSDKTKIIGEMTKGFSQNNPEIMRQAVLARGYKILEEDTTSLWHSSMIRFTK